MTLFWRRDDGDAGTELPDWSNHENDISGTCQFQTFSYLSSLTVTTPSSLGITTAILTSSLKPSNLLINTGFLVFPCLFCDLISAAILLSSRDSSLSIYKIENILPDPMPVCSELISDVCI